MRYRDRYGRADKEFFLALNLDTKNRLIREVPVSVGSLNG
jgi:DNA repair protein RadC